MSQFSSKRSDYCLLVLIGMALGKMVAASIAAVVPGDVLDRDPGAVGVSVETVASMSGTTAAVLVEMHML